MKGWKTKRLIALHTFISACAGIGLAAVIFFDVIKLEHQQQAIGKEAVVINDILRLEEGYRQWLIMMDLILGNDQTYLAAGAKRQAKNLTDLADLIAAEELAESVQNEFALINQILFQSASPLESILDGVDLPASIINQFDEHSKQLLTKLQSITSIIKEKVKNNIQHYEQQRSNIILLSIGYGFIFLTLVGGQWWLLSYHLVNPIQKLTAAVSKAQQHNTQFQFQHNSGPQEIRELAENARQFINLLEDKVVERTRWYELEKDKAIKASKAKNEFLSIMSHELRTPLNAIMGFSELLGYDDLNEEQDSNLNEITTASKKLKYLIDRIFNFIDIDNENFQLTLDQVALNPILDDCIHKMSVKMAEKQITLESDISPNYILVKANARFLADVFTNLIDNAIKFNHQNGRIYIRCNEQADKIVFSIQDTGVGVLPELQEKMFSPFVERQKNFVDGLGISLYMSRRYIELMHGKLEYSSADGGGSIFLIELPYSAAIN